MTIESIRSYSLFLILFFSSFVSYSKDHGEEKEVLLILDKIYNAEFRKADSLLENASIPLKNHPAIFLCKALYFKWKGFISSGEISHYQDEVMLNLEWCIERSHQKLKKKEQVSRMNFLLLASHGFVAEQYYRSNQSYNALLSGKKAYHYMKIGFNNTRNFPDFLYTTGIYNYYREKFPERHSYYKPFLWMFKSGNIPLGIHQLKSAYEKSIYSRVESLIYLIHILMRYEVALVDSGNYAKQFFEQYPNNPLSLIAYAENSMFRGDIDTFEKLVKYGITEEFKAKKPLELLFQAFLEEMKNQNYTEANTLYQGAISHFDTKTGIQRHFLSITYLFLSRLQMKQGQKNLAQESIVLSKKYSKYPIVEWFIEKHKQDYDL